MELSKDLQSRQEVRDLVARAEQAQKQLAEMTQEQIDAIVAAIARCGHQHARELAQMAFEETGFGNPADKEKKNLFAADTVYAAVKDLRTVGILREDRERRVWDVGVPVGVVAGIAPSTNPTSTVIYKSIIALKGGNTIVFSPHPGAKKCSCRTAELLMEAARAAGCPDGAIGCISLPTVDAVEELMKHRQVRLILATGGEAMVRAAYSSGKPAIGVGAGNGPAYLHPSCDLARAVADIFRSKTFDNGTICASEQSIIYHRDMESAVLAELQRQGGCVLTEEEAGQLAGHLFRANGTMNPKTVGKTAGELAKLAGLGDRARTAAVLLARETDAGPDNPYSHEKLCPVLALYCVENEEKALGLATGILLHEGSGHTFAIHASDESVIRRFCTRVPVSRFLVNTPAALGGIGSTTGLFPALTLGCGAVGGSSSSNNIGPLDLINIRRVAWDSEAPGPTPSPKQESHPAGVDEALLCAITDRLMKKINDRR